MYVIILYVMDILNTDLKCQTQVWLELLKNIIIQAYVVSITSFTIRSSRQYAIFFLSNNETKQREKKKTDKQKKDFMIIW